MPVITSFVPTYCKLDGDVYVTINGQNLGSGDITSVKLAGVEAAVILPAGPQMVIVKVANSSNVVAGSVVVTSTSYGIATSADLFSYRVAGGMIIVWHVSKRTLKL